MNLIVCTDKSGGLSFFNKRQSRDSLLIKHILDKISGKTIWISNYSKILFPDDNSSIKIDDNLLDKAKDDDYCFIERTDVDENLIKNVNKIILYNWNREYPKDKYLTVNFDDLKLISEEIIVGSSHDEIIEKVYQRG